MKTPLLDEIVALLRARREPVASRDLAERFLRIATADEETCRRLLAPILDGVPGVTHAAGSGWRFDAAAAAVARRSGAPESPAVREAAATAKAPTSASATDATAPPWEEPEGSQSLRDVVALAVDGVGPGGSGAPRALTFLPVVAGEELQEEHLPASGLDDEGFGAMPDESGIGETSGGSAALSESDLASLVEAIGDLPVVAHRSGREVEPLRRLALSIGLPFHPRVISAARLGHLLLGLKANHPAADLARALGVETVGPDDCRGRARMVARAYLALLPRLEAKGIASIDALLEFQNLPAEPIDLSGRAFGHDDLRTLPTGPGVYRFLDRDGAILYIGKARRLRIRVGSYFAPGARGTAKGREILERTHALVIDPVGSELEAILLEAALLQEHRPPLNRQFDVHERPAPYGPRRNIVVVLKDSDEPTCTLHMMVEGRYQRRCTGVDPHAAGDGWAAVREALASTYAGGGTAPGSDLDWALVSSYLRKHDDRVQVLDVDEAPGLDAALERLRILARGAVTGSGKLLAR